MLEKSKIYQVVVDYSNASRQKEKNLRGYIDRIVGDKGFGFIKVTGSTQDYFFHKSQFAGNWNYLANLLESNEKPPVEFMEDRGPKGLRASNVRLLREGE